MPRARSVLLVDTSERGARGSMSRYTGLVQEALKRCGNRDPAWRPSVISMSVPFQFSRWWPGSTKTWLNHGWILLTAGRRIRRWHGDLVHVLDGSYAYWLKGRSNAPVVSTVHDLIPLLQKERGSEGRAVSPLARKLLQRTWRAYGRCQRLIAVSENSKRDLVEQLGVDEAAVAVVVNALDAAFADRASEPALPAVDPYILHVGNNAWYKNRAGVVRIFSRVRQGRDLRLVLAGPLPDTALQQEIAQAGIEGAVEIIESPNDSMLLELYRGASLLLFPSLYEGFGWPPLEAMALGCPVVCSSSASLPEVVGDVALTAPPGEEARLAELAIAILEQPKLARELSKKGRVRAREFSLERMGTELIAVYEQALEAHAGTG